MSCTTISLFVLLTTFYGSSAEWCSSALKYCSYGCCGSGNYEYCCSNTNTYTYVSNAISTGVIVAIVIGCIVFVAIIVGIIACCVCCCKAASSTGTVYRAQPTHVTMVSAGQPNAGFVQPPAYPMSPQYGQPQQEGYPTQQGESNPGGYPQAPYGNMNQGGYPQSTQYGDPTSQKY